MLTENEFESLIARPESSILDFKAMMYDFSDDTDLKATAKLTKDVISFTNTIRQETSYIIIGIKEKEDGSKELIGIDKRFDDAMFQEKTKNKTFPRPAFNYFNLVYANKLFGVFEFPIIKYSTPVAPTLKMKSLEIGRIYYRRGSSNTEALAQEIIAINNWLQEITAPNHEQTFHTEIATLLKKITLGEEKLSAIFTDGIITGKKYKSNNLLDFFAAELKGVPAGELDSDQQTIKYRIQTIFVSVHKIQINPHVRTTSASVKAELDRHKDFFEYPMFFNQSVMEIESYLSMTDKMATVEMSVQDVFPEISGDYTVYGYVFSDTFLTLYKNIRQKAIDNLMKELEGKK